MKTNFAAALAEAPKHKELPFPEDEFRDRFERVRAAMYAQGIALLFVTAPESLYYLSGFQCEWYQGQSGRAFAPTSGLAIHVDHDRYIHFETPSEAILTAIATVSSDVRIFPLESRRNGLQFVLQELEAEGWLRGTAGLELYNYRPNPVIADQYRDGFAARGMAVVDATDLVRDVRHIKSPLEMEALREAARIADVGMVAAKDAIQPGVTELEVFGAFIYDLTMTGDDEVFKPMTAVNHECNFFGPGGSGMSATIETFLFHEDRAEIACQTPRDLQVLLA